ncbi:hypothetical protein OY671_009278, partial [Metschnikowia pulcherrima]
RRAGAARIPPVDRVRADQHLHGGGDRRGPVDRQSGVDLRRHAHDDRRYRAAAGADRDPRGPQGRRPDAHLRLCALRDPGGRGQRAGAAGRGVLHPVRSSAPSRGAAGYPVRRHAGRGHRRAGDQSGVDAAAGRFQGRQPERERRLSRSSGRHAGFGRRHRGGRDHSADRSASGRFGVGRGHRIHGVPAHSGAAARMHQPAARRRAARHEPERGARRH